MSASARHSLLGSDRTGGEWQIFSSVFLFLCCPQRNIYIYDPCYVRLPCADSCSFTIRSYRRRDATKREPPPREGYEVKNFPGGQFEYCWIRHRTKPLIGSGSRRDKWACVSATGLFRSPNVAIYLRFLAGVFSKILRADIGWPLHRKVRVLANHVHPQLSASSKRNSPVRKSMWVVVSGDLASYE